MLNNLKGKCVFDFYLKTAKLSSYKDGGVGRNVGGVEMGSRGGEDTWQGGSWRTEASKAVASGPHLCADKLRGTTQEGDRLQNSGSQGRKLKTQNPRL